MRLVMVGRRQQAFGFTVVEVVVAMVIVALVAIGLVTTMASASKSQTKAKVLGQQVSVAEAAYDRLAGDTEWSRSNDFGCNTMPTSAIEVTCNNRILDVAFPSELSARLPDGIDGELVRTARVVGIDDAGDGQRNADADGVRPDFYEVTLRVGAPSRLGTRRHVMRGVINPSARTSGGSIMVQVCVVSWQIDERLSIGGCPLAGRNFLAPPGNFNDSLSAMIAMLGSADQGWRSQYYLQPRNNLWINVQPGTGTAAVDMTRVSAKRATGTSVPCEQVGNGVRCRSSQVLAPTQPPHLDTGAISASTQISGLPPGMYSVSVQAPPGKEVWAEKSVPAEDQVNVQAGTRSRVLQVLRPTSNRSIRFRIRTTRTTYAWGPDRNGDGFPDKDIVNSEAWPYLHPEVGAISASLFPGPPGRLSPDESSGAPHLGTYGIGRANPGASTITIGGLAPGVYAPRVWTSGGTQTPTAASDVRFGANQMSYIYIAEPGAPDATNLPTNGAGTLHYSLCLPKNTDLCPGGGGGGGGGSPSSGGGA